ncbi:MAG: hypothetical protein RL480_1981, partial [Pseudomonadota bacterium]
MKRGPPAGSLIVSDLPGSASAGGTYATAGG